MSLSERTRAGLREMPSNAAWLLSQALKPAEELGEKSEFATAGVRDRGRRLRAAITDAAPGDGNSVEVRMRRAQEASERARDAEERAVEAEQEAKEYSDHVRKVSDAAAPACRRRRAIRTAGSRSGSPRLRGLLMTP